MDLTTEAPVFECHHIHIAWAHVRMDPCVPFGLSPSGPHGHNAGHQALAYGPVLQTWLQSGVPVPLMAGCKSLEVNIIKVFLKQHFFWPLTNDQFG